MSTTAWWIDRFGQKQVYFHGTGTDAEKPCTCSQQGDCIDIEKKCNCDSRAPEWQKDHGTISNKTALPVTQLVFKGLKFSSQKAHFTLGPLRCSGYQKSVPAKNSVTSCTDVREDGHLNPGYYLVDPTDLKERRTELVFCNPQLEPSHAQFERRTGIFLEPTSAKKEREDVTKCKPTPDVIFDAVLNTHQFIHGPILYNVVNINVGDAFDADEGSFRAPVSGVYEFSFQAWNNEETASDIYVYKNDSTILARSFSFAIGVYGSTFMTHLETGDAVKTVLVRGAVWGDLASGSGVNVEVSRIEPAVVYKHEAITTFNGSNIEQHLTNSPTAWVVEFFSSWCGQCRKFAPFWKQIATITEGWKRIIRMGAIDCAHEMNVQACRKYGAHAYPEIRFFPPGLDNQNYQGEKFPEAPGSTKLAILYRIMNYVSQVRQKHNRSDFPHLGLTSGAEAMSSECRNRILFFESPSDPDGGSTGAEFMAQHTIMSATRFFGLCVHRITTNDPLADVYGDLDSTLGHLLRQEITLSIGAMDKEKTNALLNFIQVLHKHYPGKPKTVDALESIATWLEANDGHITERAWDKNDRHVPSRGEFLGCRGSDPKYRGYPCGLWMLFHTIIMEAHDDQEGEPHSILTSIHGYIMNFFGCDYCKKHFDDMAEKFNMFHIRNKTAAVLWLWKAHNRVNWRLKGDVNEDPENPKLQFPPSDMCESCRHESRSDDEPEEDPETELPEVNWNNAEVLNFLRRFYLLSDDPLVINVRTSQLTNESSQKNYESRLKPATERTEQPQGEASKSARITTHRHNLVADLNFLLPEERITVKDLREPQAGRVQILYRKLICKIFGDQVDFNRVPQSQFPRYGDSFALTVPINICGLLKGFFVDLPMNFGFHDMALVDLLNPTKQKTVNYIGNLANFVSFYLDRMKHVTAVQQSLEGRRERIVKTLTVIEQYKSQYSDLVLSTEEKKNDNAQKMKEATEIRSILVSLEDELSQKQATLKSAEKQNAKLAKDLELIEEKLSNELGLTDKLEEQCVSSPEELEAEVAFLRKQCQEKELQHETISQETAHLVDEIGVTQNAVALAEAAISLIKSVHEARSEKDLLTVEEETFQKNLAAILAELGKVQEEQARVKQELIRMNKELAKERANVDCELSEIEKQCEDFHRDYLKPSRIHIVDYRKQFAKLNADYQMSIKEVSAKARRLAEITEHFLEFSTIEDMKFEKAMCEITAPFKLLIDELQERILNFRELTTE
ncbi:unnamed protein product [Notodromas monacha]|uniref:Sulfhydryl oxidase n=1 Tax=Notodromas monacha TaxID=399045 RepID=A0A7R9BHP4_9CRUS|nr:unnamed protein product [Notodromas monacha]CAG0914860.1 unnamed protein product [Notodromas monacha]